LSKLKDQIEALQSKQHKIELFEELLSNIKEENNSTKDPIMAEVLSEVAEFVQHKKGTIEAGTEFVYEEFTTEDLSVIKQLVDTVKAGANNPLSRASTTPTVGTASPAKVYRKPAAGSEDDKAQSKVVIPPGSLNKQIEFRLKGVPTTGTLLQVTSKGVVIRLSDGSNVNIPREQVGL